MKIIYEAPVLDLRTFDDEEILTNASTQGMTANQDVLNQMQQVVYQVGPISVTSARLEDIKIALNYNN